MPGNPPDGSHLPRNAGPSKPQSTVLLVAGSGAHALGCRMTRVLMQNAPAAPALTGRRVRPGSIGNVAEAIVRSRAGRRDKRSRGWPRGPDRGPRWMGWG
jgi:hypothetical protein